MTVGSIFVAIGRASVVAALLVSVGTIGGAIASSADEAVPVALVVLGTTFLALGPGVLVFLAASEIRARAWIRLVQPAVGLMMYGGLGCALAFADGERRKGALLGLGVLMLGAAAIALLQWVRDRARAETASTVSCPDCAETIRAEARICHHCTHRLAPAPAGVDHDGG